MAYPQVATVNGGNNTTLSTEHTVNLPANIAANDLLIVLFVVGTSSLITFPGGWTELFEENNSTKVRLCAWYRIADGNEGASITVTTSSTKSSHTSYRVTGYIGVPEVGTASIASSTTPNPPSLTSTWGAKDTLWFAFYGCDENKTTSAYPANYTDGRDDVADAAAGCGLGSARRERNAVSEDPGTFTMSASDQWVANTIAVQPSVVTATYNYYGYNST